jgi:hypothetical protein
MYCSIVSCAESNVKQGQDTGEQVAAVFIIGKSHVCERSAVPTISIKSKVHPRVTAVAGGALVVADSVMAFGGGSGGRGCGAMCRSVHGH